MAGFQPVRRMALDDVMLRWFVGVEELASGSFIEDGGRHGWVAARGRELQGGGYYDLGSRSSAVRRAARLWCVWMLDLAWRGQI